MLQVSLLEKNVNRRCLDLSTEVLWISVGQRAPKLEAVKDGGLKKILLLTRSQTTGAQVLVPDD